MALPHPDSVSAMTAQDDQMCGLEGMEEAETRVLYPTGWPLHCSPLWTSVSLSARCEDLGQGDL